LKEETAYEVDLAIRRILLIHGIILTAGGIPLIYLGDEWGTLNDYSYRGDPARAGDSRWVHRPATDWSKSPLRLDDRTPEGRVYQGLRRLIDLRKRYPVFGEGVMDVIETGNDHVLAFIRQGEGERALVFANFSEQVQVLPANLLRLYGISYKFKDLITGREFPLADLELGPYGFECLYS
jgi:amylosucrase